MPVTKSAKRALRKSLRKKARNVKTREDYKKVLKTTRKTGTGIEKAYSTLDRAAKKGVIHRRKAARLKSRLAKLIKPTAATKSKNVVAKTAGALKGNKPPLNTKQLRKATEKAIARK